MTDPIIQDVLDHLPADREARRLYLAKLAEESVIASAERRAAAERERTNLDALSLEDLEHQLSQVAKGTPEHRALVDAHRRKLKQVAELAQVTPEISDLEAELADIEAKLATVKRYTPEHRALVNRHAELINKIGAAVSKPKSQLFIY